jgi:hypothetical protein
MQRELLAGKIKARGRKNTAFFISTRFFSIFVLMAVLFLGYGAFLGDEPFRDGELPALKCHTLSTKEPEL